MKGVYEMAWENAILDNVVTSPVLTNLNDWFSYSHSAISENISSETPTWNWVTINQTFNYNDVYNASVGTFIIGDSNWGIKKELGAGTSQPYLYLYLNGVKLAGDYLERADISFYNMSSHSEGYVRSLLCGIDEENHRGTIIYKSGQYYRDRTYDHKLTWIGGFVNSENAYNWIKANEAPPTYTWQSVAGVSGKGQTYSLSQIASASINNGESVTGASASAFTSLTAQVSTMVTDDSAMSGADAGGISGSGSNSGNQSSGYAFGQGESGTNVSGGGGGYYGGEKGGSLLSGGAGSGYIGNSLVSNKKMVGYNVPTSSAEGTKTESVSVYSATKEANKPKAGNGFARIKLLSTSQDYNFTDIIKTLDMTHIKHTSGNVSNLSEYYLTDWILNSQTATQQALTYSNGVFSISDSGGVISYPITRLRGVTKLKFKVRRTAISGIYFDGCLFNVINGVRTDLGSFSAYLNTGWTDISIDISNKIVDYFEVYAGGGYNANIEIKDVVFTSY